jgi:GH25 family lysozyme M1 (1,4-beta-N-acetylmuramidase)
MWGAYHFGTGDETGSAQAQFFLDTVKPDAPSTPPPPNRPVFRNRSGRSGRCGTDSGTVNGVTGDVDRSRFTGTADELTGSWTST